MFGLKSVYFYLIACQITLIKFFKKIYFSSKNYNKSLQTFTPQQVYYNPNPFLLSIITTYKKESFKISEIDPNIFWLENEKDGSKELDLGKKGIRISKSGCLGPCEKGPVVMKYPQGDLYVDVKLEDCETILNDLCLK